MRRFAIVYVAVALLILGFMDAQAGGGVGWKGGKPVDTTVLSATSGSATGLTNIESAAGTITTLTTTDATATSLTATTLTATTINQPRYVAIQVYPHGTAATVANNLASFSIPEDLAGYVLSNAGARTYTAGTTGAMALTITKRTTAPAEATSYTIAVPTGSVIDTSTGQGTLANRTVAARDLMIINATAICTTPSKGLWVTMEFIKP